MNYKAGLVTPFAGVWIEMFVARGYDRDNNVTPFAGVWIEISEY